MGLRRARAAWRVTKVQVSQHDLEQLKAQLDLAVVKGAAVVTLDVSLVRGVLEALHDAEMNADYWEGEATDAQERLDSAIQELNDRATGEG